MKFTTVKRNSLCDNASNSNRWNQFVVNEEKEEGFGCITIMTNDDHEKCGTEPCQPNFDWFSLHELYARVYRIIVCAHLSVLCYWDVAILIHCTWKLVCFKNRYLTKNQILKYMIHDFELNICLLIIPKHTEMFISNLGWIWILQLCIKYKIPAVNQKVDDNPYSSFYMYTWDWLIKIWAVYKRS